MQPFTTAFLLLSLSLSPVAVQAAAYRRVANVVGNEFYNFFSFWSNPDPTHGRVTYVDKQTALAQNLTYASSNAFVLRTDYKNVLSAGGPGRNSVRLRSNALFGTHVVVFDMEHAPVGCGTWPALWETDDRDGRWPASGEVDIYEGVNNVSPNKVTLHTTQGCVMPEYPGQTGYWPGQRDCNIAVNGNTGCGVNVVEPNNYGAPFNANQGGWYVLERTDQYIKVWFWPRNSGSVPSGVRNGNANVDTSGWGTPSAHFPSTSTCNLADKFDDNFIIINITLCGDWAGQQSLYAGAGCPGVCNSYVEQNPGAFTDAYFQFKSIRVYTP